MFVVLLVVYFRECALDSTLKYVYRKCNSTLSRLNSHSRSDEFIFIFILISDGFSANATLENFIENFHREIIILLN